MWHRFDWGWDMGLHMLAWWALVALGVIAVAILIAACSRRDGLFSNPTSKEGP